MWFGRRRRVGVEVVAIVWAAALVAGPCGAEVETRETGAFSFGMEVEVRGTPEEVFEAFTARTIEWWDHHFSKAPKALYFETRPGGGFVEIFDDDGNGAVHATVIYVERGKSIRFTGPLGFSGYAMEMVHSIDFEGAGDGTVVKLRVRGAGEMEEGWPATVEAVWRHFLVERLQPYMAATGTSTNPADPGQDANPAPGVGVPKTGDRETSPPPGQGSARLH